MTKNLKELNFISYTATAFSTVTNKLRNYHILKSIDYRITELLSCSTTVKCSVA